MFSESSATLRYPTASRGHLARRLLRRKTAFQKDKVDKWGQVGSRSGLSGAQFGLD